MKVTDDPIPEDMTKDELYDEIIRRANLSQKETTGSYQFRREHLVELVWYLRTGGGQS